RDIACGIQDKATAVAPSTNSPLAITPLNDNEGTRVDPQIATAGSTVGIACCVDQGLWHMVEDKLEDCIAKCG
ncbi:hypothetical protein FRC09_001391, partial [Ceratobasidium sp. 395]